MSETQQAFNNTVQIVLIGATGSGKSSTGNTILGKKLFTSEASAKSVTQECVCATEVINRWKITVLDTPGWDCTALSEHDVMLQIKQAIKHLDGPYSFLLVIRVGSMETIEEIEKICTLKNELGQSFLDHTTILFSRSDDLEGQTFEEFIKEGGQEFQNLLKRCGDRCHCWNNRDSRPDKKVEELLKDLKRAETKHPDSGKSFQDKMNNKEEQPSASFSYGDQQKNATTNRKRGAVGLEPDMSENQITVLFLGMHKVGKTSSIRTLTEKCVENKSGADAVYTHPSTGLSLKVVESSGFDDKEEEIQEAIFNSLSNCSPGPHVIIIVLSVERFTPAAMTAMKHVQHCLGQNARKHTMILFTKLDNLEGGSIEDFIQDNQHLKDLVNIHENRYHALNNRDTRNKKQGDELLEKIKTIHEKNDKRMYTNKQDFDHNKGMPSVMGSRDTGGKAPSKVQQNTASGISAFLTKIPSYLFKKGDE